MIVHADYDVVTPMGTRSYGTSLDDSDGRRQWPDQWDTWTNAQRNAALTAAVEEMCVRHLYAEGILSKDEATAKIKFYRSRLPSMEVSF